MQTKPTDNPVDSGADVDDGQHGAPDVGGTGGRDQTPVGYAASLVGLCEFHKGKLPQGQIAYEIKCGGKSYWAFAKSKGQAALLVCDVSRVSDKELVKAAFEAMGVK